MNSPFKAIQVSENVWWVGAIDWELADFHGYATPRGSSYNAYLVLAERTALIDTVKAPYVDEMMARIASVIDPEKIDVIVSNHAEMDHSGALPEVIGSVAPSQLVASANGVAALEKHQLTPDIEVTAVKEGDSLSLGDRELTFLLSSMVHWPDSMFSYLDSDRILFSNDAFGMHLASSQRWADELPNALVEEELKIYYANILWPTSKAVGGVLKKLDGFEQPIDIIAPDHGPAWRGELSRPLDLYRGWAAGEVDDNKAVIVFDTMWGSTARLARVLADGLGRGGMDVRVLPLAKTTRATLAAELLDAGFVAVGSPNLNGGIFPTVADALTYVGNLRPAKPPIKALAFGSYGWSPAAFKALAAMMDPLGAEFVEEAQTVNYVPGSDDLNRFAELGEQIATATRSS